MAVRASMAALLARLRILIGDPSKVTWPDDQALQDMLDAEHQSVWRYLPLRIEATRQSGGFTYNHFYSDETNNWEGDVVLVDGSYTDITSTASLSDLIVGHWQFPTQPGLPVYATGKTYDLFGAAADLLEAEIGQYRRKGFDATDASGASMKRSQTVNHLQEMADRCRARQRPRSAPSTRPDAQTPGSDVSNWAGRGGWTNTGDPRI